MIITLIFKFLELEKSLTKQSIPLFVAMHFVFITTWWR